MATHMTASASLPDHSTSTTTTPNSISTHRSTFSEHSLPLPWLARPLAAHDISDSSSPTMDRPKSVNHSRSQSYGDAFVDVPARSTSLRRKPVPTSVTLPKGNSSLPPSHPFAMTSPVSGPPTPLSPGVRAEEDLFYAPPRSGPLPPRRPRQDSPGSTASAEDAFRAREEALKAREEALKRREEFLRREEAIRQREEELQAREEALAARESASMGRKDPPAAIHPDTLSRPLPPVPDPSQPSLVGSSDSLPALVTPATTPTTSTRPAHHPVVAKALGQPLARPVSRLTQHSSYTTSTVHSREEPFTVNGLPSKEAILEASTLFLRDEDGGLVCFGDLMPHPASPAKASSSTASAVEEPAITKTVFFFIRHFWCGQCQDYTFASLALLDPEAIRQAGVRIVVVSNGSWKIIKSYKKMFKCPFPIYVDGPRKLYKLLGMTKLTNDFGPWFKGRAEYHRNSVPLQLVQSFNNAFKMTMANPGKITQLGGEFIFSSPDTCDFAHRMTNTSNHMEAPDVLRLAGVSAPTLSESQAAAIEAEQQEEIDRMTLEADNWRKEQEAEIDRIRRRKAERRGQIYDPKSNPSKLGLPTMFDGEDPAEFEKRRQSVIDWNEANTTPRESMEDVADKLDAVDLNGDIPEETTVDGMEPAAGTGNLGVEVEKA